MGVNVASGQITGTTTAMEYSLDSTNGVDGTWTKASAATTPVTFTAGKLYVRQTAVPTNFSLVATISPAASAPTSGVTFDVSAGTVTGLGSTYEYSINGGAYTTTASGVNFLAGPITVRTKATASALPSAPQTVGTVTAPGAPTSGVTFNVAAGTVTGLDSTYEYSINGGLYTTTATGVNFLAGPITVRTKATASALPSAPQTVGTVTAPGAPTSGVTYDVAAGTVTGLGTTYEYSLDGGATYTTTASSVNFTAGNVLVRTKVTATAFASLPETVGTIAAATVPTSGITYDVAAKTVTGLGTTYEYSLDGGTTYETTASSVNFTAGNVLVRTKATATALASLPETVGTIATAATAPAANKAKGKNAGTIKLTGLTNGVTYEYVVDSNATLAGDAAEWSVAPFETLSSGTEIDNIVAVVGQYVHLRVKATETNLASNVQDGGDVVAEDIKTVADVDEEDQADVEKESTELPTQTSAAHNSTVAYPTAKYGTTIAWSLLRYEDVKVNGSRAAGGYVDPDGLRVTGDNSDIVIFEATITKGNAVNKKEYIITIY